MRLLLALLAVAALLATAAAPAGAAATRSAQRFVEAVERGERTLADVRPEIERRFREWEREQPRCDRALRGDFSDAVDGRIELQGGAVAVSGLFHPYVELGLPGLRQIVADLYAVTTRDRALRAGRQAWRRGVGLFESFDPPIERPCEALERWRDTGFAADQAPISRADAQRYFDTLEQTGAERDGRRYGRAVKRLRKLGVTRRRAEAFDGHLYLDIVSGDH